MNLSDYEQTGRALYAGFANAVASILKSALASRSDLTIQEIQFRAKDSNSLAKKLRDRGKTDSPEIAVEIKDLAGCRLIFYTNNDVEAFAQSRLLNDNFQIDFDRTKIHYPTTGGMDANELFISENYVVQFDEKRSKLPEYVGFAGLQCEVQVQTILNHAWAQMAHDTIYKRPVETGFGTALIDNINARLAKIMRDHLLPAGYEFQKIMSDYRRVLAGKEMFDAGALHAIRASSNLNDLHQTIERFASLVLPNYDNINDVLPDVSETLLEAAERALSMPEISYKTGWGEFPGESRATIVGDVCAILSNLRYLDIDRSFDAILRLAGKLNNELEQNALDAFATKLAEHNLDVWNRVGAEVQIRLVDRVGKLDDGKIVVALATLTKILSQVLKNIVTGRTYHANSIMLHHGAVLGSDGLIAARRGAIIQLKRLYELAAEEARAEILYGLSAAGETPGNAAYSSALGRMLMGDLVHVVRFYGEIAPGKSLEGRRKLEELLFRNFYEYFKLPLTWTDDASVAATQRELIAEIQKTRLILEADPDFAIYKSLVGYDSISRRMWDECSYDSQADRAAKSEEIDILARSVSTDNIAEWVIRLNRYVLTQSDDLAMFADLGTLLERVAEHRPHLVDFLLANMSERLGRFLPSILHGLAKGGQGVLIDDLIDGWIAERQHLHSAIWYFQFAVRFDENRLVKLYDRALADNDANAVLDCNIAAIRQYPVHPGNLIDRIFLPCIEYFKTIGSVRWLRPNLLNWRNQQIVRDLDETRSGQIIEAMFLAPDLEPRGEELLAEIAEGWPELVIAFIGRRFAFAASDSAPKGFKAVPYRLHNLSKPLASSLDLLFAATRRWYDADNELFRFRGGRLVAAVVPDFSNDLDARLRTEIAGGSITAAEFVLEILFAYHGNEGLFPLCREIVVLHGTNGDLLELVRAVLLESDGLTGEHGWALALADKRRVISEWLADSSDAVRNFAIQFVHYIDQMAAHESRLADQRVAMRNIAFSD